MTRGVLEVEIEGLPRAWPAAAPASREFLAAFLPVRVAGVVRAAAGGRHAAAGGAPAADELGMARLWVKDDSRNPSGSTKDRASLLVVAKAVEYGFDTVAAASTGNAATALAAVAAAAGVRAVVFVPAAAPRAKLVQMASYGARVVPVQGSYDDAFELCLAACREFGWYNRNTALNPFTIEGKKTAALEIAAALAPEVPDAVLVPTGDGVILAGVAKGFADLVEAGLADRVPRLIAVQPEGSAAIVDAVEPGTRNRRAGPRRRQRRRQPGGPGAPQRPPLPAPHPRVRRRRRRRSRRGDPGRHRPPRPRHRRLRRAGRRGLPGRPPRRPRPRPRRPRRAGRPPGHRHRAQGRRRGGADGAPSGSPSSLASTASLRPSKRAEPHRPAPPRPPVLTRAPTSRYFSSKFDRRVNGR